MTEGNDTRFSPQTQIFLKPRCSKFLGTSILTLARNVYHFSWFIFTQI